MSDLFSLNWGKPQPQGSPVEPSQPLDGEEVTRLNAYAEAILKVLRKAVPNSGYDQASIGRLSEDLTANGSRYTGDHRVKIANMYGAFLGKAILATYSEHPAAWVRWRGDVGLEFAAGANRIRKIVFPITRVFKHIENGESDSIYSHFIAFPEFLAADPRANSSMSDTPTDLVMPDGVVVSRLFAHMTHKDGVLSGVGVEAPGTLDAVVVGKGQTFLVWAEPSILTKEAFPRFEEKINTYVAYALDGRLVKQYPDAANTELIIYLVLLNAQPDGRLESLRSVAPQLKQAGFEFVVREQYK
jgi:hypothetical protein